MDYNTKIVGTHNGIFHVDEVVAVALLYILYDGNIEVVRSRKKDELEECDIVVDVGNGKYDHHMKGGNGSRGNGTPYASCGLVFKDFGREILRKIGCSRLYIDECYEIVDKMVIEPVDRIDNGIYSSSIFEFIPKFLPIWTTSEDFNSQFEEVLSLTVKILKREIEFLLSRLESEKYLEMKLSYNKDNILELPCQNIDWIDKIIEYNERAKVPIDFVIFPYPDGGYAAQAVPKSIDEKFSQRIPFPKEWAGLTDTLPTVSNVETATFCHNFCFFARAETIYDIYKMCKIASGQI